MAKLAAIYDPYLDTLGGGERYCLTVAEILLNHGWQVDLFWSGKPEYLSTAQQRFSLKLEKLNLIPDIFGLVPQKIELIEDLLPPDRVISPQFQELKLFKRLFSLIKKYRQLKKYDVLFYLSDGSFPFLFARKNFFHIQVPFKNNIRQQKLVDRLVKSRLINRVICNSKFTLSFIQPDLLAKTTVIYPPVSVEDFSTSDSKENIILSVGRFDNILNTKRQDVLIDVFIKLFKQNKNLNWKLILAGSSQSDEQHNHYLIHLKSLASGYPIEFFINPDFSSLKDIYSKSKIFWHATGFEIDEDEHPENTEHFGISPVEAMASGVVPLLVEKGGLKELIKHGDDGYFWNTKNDLLDLTKFLIKNEKELKKVSNNAINSSRNFSKDVFEKNILGLFENQ